MNSFFVPQLGSQIYTMAGMTSQLNLQADQAGTYRGLSAQFSGDGFAGHALRRPRCGARMLTPNGSPTPRLGGATLDMAAYAELAKPSKNLRSPRHIGRSSRSFSKPSSTRPRRPCPEPSGGPGGQDTPPSRRKGSDARQAELVGYPVRPADPAGAPRSSMMLVIVGVARLGDGKGPLALSLARVDHLGRPQAHRRHVLRAGAGDADPRLHRRDHDALAAGARLQFARAICRRSISTRSSPRTARS